MCTSCKNANTCTSCAGGAVANGKQCLCPSGKYLDAGSSTCIACSTLHSECTACTDANTCTTCSTNYTPFGKQCCLTTEYWNTDNSICTACSTLNPYCKSCKNSATCTSCKGWREPDGEECITKASISTESSSAQFVADISLGFSTAVLAVIAWSLVKFKVFLKLKKMMKIGSVKVRPYSDVQASPRNDLSRTIRRLLQTNH